MLLHGSTGTEQALKAVGEILEAQGDRIAVAVVGGAALNLLGVVDRTTRDVDILALGLPPDSPTPRLVEPPEQLPEPLVRAARLVAGRLGLADDWLNAGPALQWRQGLPDGLEQRVCWRQYGGLNLGVVDRRDLVFLKLYAAADSTGASSVHYQDLLALSPGEEELHSATDWVRSQDVSPEFHQILEQVLQHVRADTQADRE